MFDCELHGGDRPAQRAVRRLYSGVAQDQALRSVNGARFVMAVAASVLPGRSVLLELERERFEVRDRSWSHVISPETAVLAHLVPSGRRGEWLLGPGWLEWPIRIGPNLRKELSKLQMDPVAVERVLQARERPEDQRPAPPQDETLVEAVARMTSAAEEAGVAGLIMSASEWEQLVLAHLDDADALAFSRQIVDRAGNANSVDDLDRWMQLAMNIWNATPQPDRGGKTAYELAREQAEK